MSQSPTNTGGSATYNTNTIESHAVATGREPVQAVE
jgi:hypothetical protein